jgi:hypothetical protein
VEVDEDVWLNFNAAGFEKQSTIVLSMLNYLNCTNKNDSHPELTLPRNYFDELFKAKWHYYSQVNGFLIKGYKTWAMLNEPEFAVQLLRDF